MALFDPVDDSMDIERLETVAVKKQGDAAHIRNEGDIDIEDVEDEEDDDDDDEEDVEDEEEDEDDDDDEIEGENLDDEFLGLSARSPHSNATNPTTIASGASSGAKKSPSLPMATDQSALASKYLNPVRDYPKYTEKMFTWLIDNWQDMQKDPENDLFRSGRFELAGFEWDILVFPKGNKNNCVAIYLEPHPKNTEPAASEDTTTTTTDAAAPTPPKEWYVCAQFILQMWNPDHPEVNMPLSAYHRFTQNETDWGFSNFLDLKHLSNPIARLGHSFPLLVEGNRINISTIVRVIDDTATGMLWHNFNNYDSKKATGYVGLNNQGATCYLNSLLQSYFHTRWFRKLVYQIPTSSNDDSVSFNLQKIFYLLQTSPDPVATMELTKSFGWHGADAFTQHDVQELNRILMDRLEIAMIGSGGATNGNAESNNGGAFEGDSRKKRELQSIFVGKMKSYIKCVNVNYESSRREDFWDIQLNVRGFPNLAASFGNYIATEMLEGENKYQAGDEFGYQDAKMGVVFEHFPPVLHLQLKRFDFMIDDLVKIDDFYEFPDKIDLKSYLDEELPAEVLNENWTYKLHGVLVHQGSITNGHYYTMIKPMDKDEWFRFDDDRVWKVTPHEVFDDNFGCHEITQQDYMRMTRSEQTEHAIRRVTLAYMLVYYRELKLDQILLPDVDIEAKYIPKHIPQQIALQAKNLKRQEQLRQEQLYYTYGKYITLENFTKHVNNFDLYNDPTPSNQSFFDNDDLDNYHKFKIKKAASFQDLVKEFVELLGHDKFSLVPIIHRTNHTNRTTIPLTSLDERLDGKTIAQIYSSVFNKRYDEFIFFVLEHGKGIDLVSSDLVDENDPQVPALRDVNNILIFIKLFDGVDKLQGLTYITVSSGASISSIFDALRGLLNLEQLADFAVYEEFSPTKINQLNPTLSFAKAELSNGDILAIQVNPESAKVQLKDYYHFLVTRLHIIVRPLNADADEEDSDFVDISAEKQAVDLDKMETDVARKDSDASVEGNAVNDAGTVDMWISISYTYSQFAKEIGERLKLNPEYLRLFIVNHQGIRYPLKSTHALSHFFTKSVPISQTTTFEYEVLNIPLKEYETLKLVKIHWLTTIMNYQVYELLVPKQGTVSQLIDKLVHKLNIPQDKWGEVLLWAGINHNYYGFIKFNSPLESVDDKLDLYCGIFPNEVQVLEEYGLVGRYLGLSVNEEDTQQVESNQETHESEEAQNGAKSPTNDEVLIKEKEACKVFKEQINLLPVFHFHKSSSYHHGVPFIFIIFPEETFAETKARLQKKLGLGQQAMEKIRFALLDLDNKGKYLDSAHEESMVLFDEIGKLDHPLSLALDHPDRTPKKQSQYDRGISIK